MEIVAQLIDIFLHLDEYLGQVISQYGALTYLLLFLVIFMETGLVVTPFLPGDSLIFAAGTFASYALADPTTGAKPPMNIWALWALLSFAAVFGDTVNYWIGHFIGPRAFSGEIRFLKKEYLDRTHAFFEKYGGKTIILARFVPIVRTFAPFVAGVGAMTYSHFIAYNLIGGLAWVSIFLWFGYFFGNLKFVQDNFSLIVIAIILISVLPMVYEFVKARLQPTKKAETAN
ncbi:MAG: DedA family protein [Anaerolineales bacterium]|jgi:membrane-associated protein|nr:DedA family protein [Anaerolineales bacterium]